MNSEIEQLRTERLKRRMTQFDLYPLSGIRPNWLSMLENGIIQPKPEERSRWLEALGFTNGGGSMSRSRPRELRWRQRLFVSPRLAAEILRLERGDYAPLSWRLAGHLTTDCAECLDAMTRIYLHRDCLAQLKDRFEVR